MLKSEAVGQFVLLQFLKAGIFSFIVCHTTATAIMWQTKANPFDGPVVQKEWEHTVLVSSTSFMYHNIYSPPAICITLPQKDQHTVFDTCQMIQGMEHRQRTKI